MAAQSPAPAAAEMDQSVSKDDHQTVGVLLRLQREAQGLAIDDIARETRIPRRHLISFEADQHEALPARTYAVGFLRSYAHYLGLSGDAMVAQFKAETSRIEPMQAPSYGEALDDSRSPTLKLALGAAAIAVLAVGGAWLYFGRSEPVTPVTLPAAEPADVVAPAPSLPAEQPAEVPAPVTDPLAADPLGQAADGPAAEPVTPAPEPAVPVSGGVSIRAIEDSWVRISDGGARAVKMDTLRAGEVFDVPDLPGLTLQTGNAGGLEIRVDGKPIAPLGGRGIIVRNVALDRQSLLQRLEP